MESPFLTRTTEQISNPLTSKTLNISQLTELASVTKEIATKPVATAILDIPTKELPVMTASQAKPIPVEELAQNVAAVASTPTSTTGTTSTQTSTPTTYVDSTDNTTWVDKYASSDNNSDMSEKSDQYFPINVDLGGNQTTSTAMPEEEKRKRTILIASVVLLVLIVLVTVISLKNRK